MDKTIWVLETVDENGLEDALDEAGVFSKLEDLFPAKVNLFFERKLKAKIEERKDAVKFLSKEKSRNISKWCYEGYTQDMALTQMIDDYTQIWPFCPRLRI